MASQSPIKTSFEILALCTVIGFPLWGIIWYVTTAGGTVAASSPTDAGVPAATAAPAVAQGIQPAASIVLDGQSSLPATVTAGQVVPFSFTLINTGTAAGTFSYRVYVTWKNGEQDVIDENSIQLGAGSSSRVPESLKFETASARGEVYIEIASPPERAQFPIPRA